MWTTAPIKGGSVMNASSIHYKSRRAFLSEVFLASLLIIFLLISVFSTICYAEKAAKQKQILTGAANLAAEKIEALKEFSSTGSTFDKLSSSQGYELSDDGNYNYLVEVISVNSELKHVRVSVYQNNQAKTTSPLDINFGAQDKLIAIGTYFMRPGTSPEKYCVSVNKGAVVP
jgi:hypothetical protein